MLVHPKANDHLALTTDASGVGVGATLACSRGPLSYFNKSLNKVIRYMIVNCWHSIYTLNTFNGFYMELNSH